VVLLVEQYARYAQNVEAERKAIEIRVNLKASGVFSQCRDKDSLDIFWLSDESLEESDNLPDPDVLAQKSSKTSKPPSNNSVKSPRFLNGADLYRKIRNLTNDKCWNCSR
jgi:hypothetical protein